MNAPKSPGSLIERAADAYGLGDFARRAPATPVTKPPFVETPPAFAQPRIHAPAAPAPAPVAKPAPTAAMRPVTRADAVAIDRKKLAEQGMIVPGAPASVLAEEFRLVKRQLLLTARKLRDEPSKARTVLVCSARPDEGKTFCAINLGVSLAAERDTQVLLIDGDFAKRDLLPRLGLNNGQGFLDSLADPALDPETFVQPTDIPQLSLLGAGTRTNEDTELLASDRTRQVIDRLLAADPTRILVFDSPPALAASPASVFALYAGQVMMVVRADSTGEAEIRDAVGLLDACPHIQLVLNQVRHQPGGYRFGDYYSPVEDVK
jgi:Mrp family chromosome partitioning ATPase